jgi:hypothetical protein
METTMNRFANRTVFALLALFLSLGALASNMPRLEQFGKSLNLTPAQQVQFDAAAAATQRVLAAKAMAGAYFKTQAQTEFAKARPDLDALAKLRDASEAAVHPLHIAARTEWLKLYAMLSDEQVATVKAHLKEKFDNLEAVHQFVMRLLVGGAGN